MIDYVNNLNVPIGETRRMNCPNCNNSNYSKKFTSYSQVDYKNCNNCGCVYQDPIIKLNYSQFSLIGNDICVKSLFKNQFLK